MDRCKRICMIALLSMFVSAQANLINEQVSRVIDLRSHLVQITTTVTMKNGQGGPVTTFKYTVDPTHAKDLTYISFSKAGGESSSFKAIETESESKVYIVTLPSRLASNEAFQFVAEETYAHAINPFPKEITQSQNQLVVFRGNHFYYSPYVTVKQTTTIRLPSKTIESFSKFGSPKQDGSTIKYAESKEFDNVEPFGQNGMKIHYENNNPFLTISKLTRVIEVSHWGNIAVEESLSIRHTGAKLKGSFSRYDYQRLPNNGASSVRSFKTILPAASSNVYYRDVIGNISTSNLYKTHESVDLEIRPRFPLFGSWKTSYCIGYNLPIYNYLYNRGDVHALKMRFIDHVMDDQLIEDFTLKIILPEGSKNIKVSLPFLVNREPDELHYTYLDTVGRPVITMKKSNLVEQHIEDFTLSYTFNRLLLLQEPLLVVGAFFLLFFTVILVVRLDFSIIHDQASETKLKIRGLIEQVQEQQAKRNDCYNAYETALAKYKSSKDASGFNNSRKSIEKDHKDAANSINQLLNKLRDELADTAEKGDSVVLPKKEATAKVAKEQHTRGKKSAKSSAKKVTSKLALHDVSAEIDCKRRIFYVVSNLNQIDASLKDKMAHRVQLAEKLLNKKIARDQYLEQDGKVQKSIEILKDQITDAMDSLL